MGGYAELGKLPSLDRTFPLGSSHHESLDSESAQLFTRRPNGRLSSRLARTEVDLLGKDAASSALHAQPMVGPSHHARRNRAIALRPLARLARLADHRPRYLVARGRRYRRIDGSRRCRAWLLLDLLRRRSLAHREDTAQQRVDTLSDRGRFRFAGTGHVQRFDRESIDPFQNLIFGAGIIEAANQQRPAIPPRAFNRPFCSRTDIFCSSVARSSSHNHQRPIRIPDIPFCPLRSRQLRRVRASIARRFFQRKLCRNNARLTYSPRRTPPPDLKPAIPRRPQRRLVDSGLAAGNDLR